MALVDVFDHLTAINSRFRRVKTGVWQTLGYYLYGYVPRSQVKRREIPTGSLLNQSEASQRA